MVCLPIIKLTVRNLGNQFSIILEPIYMPAIRIFSLLYLANQLSRSLANIGCYLENGKKQKPSSIPFSHSLYL